MLVTFERVPQFHEGFLGVLVLEELDTFSKLNHGIELYCSLGSLRCKSEVHGGPQVLNVDDLTTVDGSIAGSLLARRPVLTERRQPGGAASGFQRCGL